VAGSDSPNADSLGRAGQGADSVNTHFFARFGEAALLSIIGAGASNVGVGNLDQYNSAAQYRVAIAQSFQQSAGQSLQSTLPQKPTLRIYQGAQINVFVAHDLSFYNVLSAGTNLGSNNVDGSGYYSK
jgi:type IV secretion system protein VirB10